jgi:hypothetical protein
MDAMWCGVWARSVSPCLFPTPIIVSSLLLLMLVRVSRCTSRLPPAVGVGGVGVGQLR